MTQATIENEVRGNYRNFMTESHRRFHDRIVADLNGILPICNQGKCTAADISTNLTEQQQITDLMQKVEHLCVHLSESVTDLFAQYYRERGRFCGAAYCTTAYIKVNLVDRTLQDRATDIRWWAKEPLLAASVGGLKKIGSSLTKDFKELSAYLEASVATFRIPTLATGWTSVDLAENVRRIEAFYPNVRGLMFNQQVRAQFEAELKSVTDLMSKGEGQQATIKYIGKVITKLASCDQHVNVACDQLEKISSTYPSLFDLVVTDDDGFVIANAKVARRDGLLASNVSDQVWYQKVVKSVAGQTHIQQDESSEDGSQRIAFVTAIRNSEDRNSGTIGTLAALCDFQSEVQSMLEDYMPRDDNGSVCDGWYSFFTDQRGVVICSSDPAVVWPGSQCELPRSHRGIAPCESYWSHAVFKGQESLVFSARSDGSQSFAGSGWISHLVAPASEIMQAEKKNSRIQISRSHLMQSKLVPEINKATYLSLQDDRQAIKLISLNGILFASQLGKRGAALAPVFDKITVTGDSATSRMEAMLHEMASSEIELNLHSLETLSKQAVDLMGQKIHERSHALRLWTLNSGLRSALASPQEATIEEANQLLRMINDDYPVYKNMFLISTGGEVLACSRPKKFESSEAGCVSDHGWFCASLRDSRDPSVRVFELNNDEFGDASVRGKQASLIFSCPVSGDGDGKQAGGVLACLFSWRNEAANILRSCLPNSAANRVIPGSLAFFTNSESQVLESTNPSIAPVGQLFSLPDEHTTATAGKSIAGTFEFGDTTYILSTSKADKRRGLGEMAWSAHVMRPLI